MTHLERCRPWIEAALAEGGGGFDFDAVAREVEQGTMQLWPAPDGCAVTQVLNLPKKRVFHVFLAGGDMNAVLSLIEGGAAWARAQGCTSMTLSGRKGWQRVLKDWRLSSVEMERGL